MTKNLPALTDAQRAIMNDEYSCVKGMRCPECGQVNGFTIEAAAPFPVFPDGTGDPDTSEVVQVDWDEQSRCSCPQCQYQASAARFTTGYRQPTDFDLEHGIDACEDLDSLITALRRVMNERGNLPVQTDASLLGGLLSLGA